MTRHAAEQEHPDGIPTGPTRSSLIIIETGYDALLPSRYVRY
jgi:hypothetical protein